MFLGSSPQSAILRWPVSFKVTVEIDSDRVDKGSTVGIVGLRLLKMGGKFVAWTPNVDHRPAVAQFEFSNPADRDRFIADALEIPGVSVTATQFV